VVRGGSDDAIYDLYSWAVNYGADLVCEVTDGNPGMKYRARRWFVDVEDCRFLCVCV
jgi:hypothetical protein